MSSAATASSVRASCVTVFRMKKYKGMPHAIVMMQTKTLDTRNPVSISRPKSNNGYCNVEIPAATNVVKPYILPRAAGGNNFTANVVATPKKMLRNRVNKKNVAICASRTLTKDRAECSSETKMTARMLS